MKDSRRLIQLRSCGLALAVALSPALFQTGYSCERGDTHLGTLEVEVSGQNNIVGFHPDTRSYDVTINAAEVLVRAITVDPTTNATYQLYVDGTSIDGGGIGPGGGEVTLNPPAGLSRLSIGVAATAGAVSAYIVNITNLTDSATKTIAMSCGNDLGIIGTPGPSEFELSVEPLSEINLGQPFDAQITGYAGLPEASLDATGGLADLVPLRVAIIGGSVPVVVRSGASDADVSLMSAPVPGSYTCAVDANGNFGRSAGPFPSCDPANDEPFLQDPGTGLYANYDCVGFGGMIDPLNPCAPFVELTIIDGTGDACAACAALSATKGQVCQNQLAIDPMNAYCSTIDEGSFPLTTETGIYVPDTEAEVLFGFSPFVDWYEVGFGGFPVNFPAPGAGLQILVAYGGFTTTGLFPIQIECVMGDGSGALPDSALVSVSRTPSWIGAEQVSQVVGWRREELLETDTSSASTPEVAIGDDGDAVAVWVQSNQLYANRFTAPGGWGSRELLHTGTGLVIDPKVGIAASGDAVVVWEEEGFPIRTIHAIRLTSGTWGGPESLGIGGVKEQDAQVAVAANGDAVVVWQKDNAPSEIYANRLTSGDWGGPEVIGAGPGYRWRPQVAIGPTGDAVVVWDVFVAGLDRDIYSTRMTSGVWDVPREVGYQIEVEGEFRLFMDGCATCIDFGATQALECEVTGDPLGAEGGCSFASAENPQLGVDHNSEPVLVWEKNIGSEHSIYASRSTSGSYGPPELLETAAGAASNPRVSVDPSGRAVAVWEQDDGAVVSVYSARYAPVPGAWSPPVLLEAAPGVASDAWVRSDETGDAVAVWQQEDGTATSVYTARLTSGSWNPAELLETGAGPATDPRVAVDHNGDSVMVWAQDDGAATNIYANYFDDEAGDATNPQVATDAIGNAVAVWEHEDDGVTSIHGSRLTDGIWGVPELLDTSPLETGDPQVGVDPSGNAVVVWRQDDASSWGAYGRYLLAGVWGFTGQLWTGTLFPSFALRLGVPADVANTVIVVGQDDLSVERIYAIWGNFAVNETLLATNGVLHPEVATAPNGDAVAVWETLDEVYASRLSSGGPWGAPALLSSGADLVFRPKVAVQPGGDAIAGWAQLDGSAYSVYTARLVSGAWASPELVWTGADFPFDAQAAVADNGDAVVVWGQDDAGANNIYANRSTSGTWGAPVLLETGSGVASAPSLALDPNGNAMVVWEQDDGSATSIYANRLVSGTWDGPVLLETNPGDASTPRVTMSPNGNAVVVWEQQDGGRTYIHANRFR